MRAKRKRAEVAARLGDLSDVRPGETLSVDKGFGALGAVVPERGFAEGPWPKALRGIFPRPKITARRRKRGGLEKVVPGHFEPPAVRALAFARRRPVETVACVAAVLGVLLLLQAPRPHAHKTAPPINVPVEVITPDDPIYAKLVRQPEPAADALEKEDEGAKPEPLEDERFTSCDHAPPGAGGEPIIYMPPDEVSTDGRVRVSFPVGGQSEAQQGGLPPVDAARMRPNGPEGWKVTLEKGDGWIALLLTPGAPADEIIVDLFAEGCTKPFAVGILPNQQ